MGMTEALSRIRDSSAQGPQPAELARLRPLGPIEILDATFTVYLESPGTFLTLAAVPMACAAILRFAVAAAALAFNVEAGGDMSNAINQAAGWITMLAATGVVSATTARTALRLWWASDDAADRLNQNTRIVRLVGITFVFMIPWLTIAAIVVFLTLGVSEDSTAMWIVALVVLIPVSALFALFTSLGPTASVSQDLGVGASLGRSFKLMGAAVAWLRAMLTYLMIALLITIMFFAVSLGGTALLDALPFVEESLPHVAVSFIADFLLFTLAAPLTGIIPAMTYLEGRVRIEGLDIELLLAAGRRDRDLIGRKR